MGGWGGGKGEHAPSDVVVKRHIPHTECHYSGIGDVDRADHVCAVGVGLEFYAEVCDVEAGEFVEAYC